MQYMTGMGHKVIMFLRRNTGDPDPAAAQKSATASSASGESPGVMKPSALWYSVGKALAMPLFSVPAMGWLPVKWMPLPASSFFAASMITPLTLPMSVMTEPGLHAFLHTLRKSGIAGTGRQSTVKSA